MSLYVISFSIIELLFSRNFINKKMYINIYALASRLSKHKRRVFFHMQVTITFQWQAQTMKNLTKKIDIMAEFNTNKIHK